MQDFTAGEENFVDKAMTARENQQEFAGGNSAEIVYLKPKEDESFRTLSNKSDCAYSFLVDEKKTKRIKNEEEKT